ncbi:MAG: nitrous oxide reductase family maturation protein NosD [Legionellales bacterium]|nr:nitrous oxide reductase family maturation protein NosD [Legionellales bacterium]
MTGYLSMTLAQDGIIPENRADLLEKALAHAKPNTHIILAGGNYQGNFQIRTPLVLESQDIHKPAHLSANNKGSVLTIRSSNTKIRHLIFEDSGKDMFGKDSCLFVEASADNVTISDNTFQRCGFSIWVHSAPNIKISHNVIIGPTQGLMSDRGNGIYLFYTNHSVVEDNLIRYGRDGIYILASHGALIEHNVFDHTRFGIHYMYSDNCTVNDNVTTNSSVGAAIMYSKNLKIFKNTFDYNLNHGLLLRDILYSHIFSNVSTHNIDGLFLGSAYYNLINNNRFSNNQIGAVVTGASDDNRVTNNNFIDNDWQAKFLGVRSIIWSIKGRGNFWSTYRGWDADKNGIGDQIYYVTNLANWLTFSYPILRIILESPAMVLLQKIETQFPVIRRSAIIDEYPLMKAANL